jgi:hypothetical protein
MKKTDVIPLRGEDKKIDYTRKHDLTIEEVRACSMFKDLTEEQVKEVIQTLKQYATIAYELYENQQIMLKNSKNGTNIDKVEDRKIIPLKPPKRKAA